MKPQQTFPWQAEHSNAQAPSQQLQHLKSPDGGQRGDRERLSLKNDRDNAPPPHTNTPKTETNYTSQRENCVCVCVCVYHKQMKYKKENRKQKRIAVTEKLPVLK